MAKRRVHAEPARVSSARVRESCFRNQSLTFSQLLERFDQLSCSGDSQWTACCPAHPDSNPSLSIGVLDQRVVMHCHSGCCKFENICDAIGTSQAEVASMRVSEDELERASSDTFVPPTRVCRAIREPKVDPQAAKKWSRLAERFSGAATDDVCEELADSLDVRVDALRAIEIGWKADWECWTFPERDGDGRIIGISTRYRDGKKGFIKGGNRGLIFPASWQPSTGSTVFVVEGASDTAAGIAEGLNVIGRPSAKGGVDHLSKLLADAPADCRIVVLGEMDAKQDGSWPGKEAAIAVADQLTRSVTHQVGWMLPPKEHKDLRTWLHAIRTEDVDWLSKVKPDEDGFIDDQFDYQPEVEE